MVIHRQYRERRKSRVTSVGYYNTILIMYFINGIQKMILGLYIGIIPNRLKCLLLYFLLSAAIALIETMLQQYVWASYPAGIILFLLTAYSLFTLIRLRIKNFRLGPPKSRPKNTRGFLSNLIAKTEPLLAVIVVPMTSYFVYVDHHNASQVLPVVLEAAKTGDSATFKATKPIITFGHQLFGLSAPGQVVEAHNVIHYFPNETGRPPVDYVEIPVSAHINRTLNYTRDIVAALDEHAVNEYLKEHYGR